MSLVTLPMLRHEMGPVLAGRLEGQRAFVRNLEALPSTTKPLLVALDFGGVELATSSFLSEAVVRFRDHLRMGRTPAYLIVANLSEKVAEELQYFLARASDAVLSCDLSPSGETSNEALIGALDQKLGETFELVKGKKETSAGELHSESVDQQKIGPTAWNNRLSTLAAKSLLFEVPLGRAKKYRPLLETA